MALNDVFQKTVKGTAEIAARTIKVAPMTRMALVMVDGVKPFSELAAKLGGEGPAQAAVSELLGHGLVELHAAAAPAAGATAATAATARFADADHPPAHSSPRDARESRDR